MFWLSLKNLTRYTSRIKSMFSAIDADMDEIEKSINTMDSRVTMLEQGEDLLAVPGDVDINNFNDTIIKTTDTATITTSFSSDSGIDTITSMIVMKTGEYDYKRVTTITPDGDIDRVRTTVTPIAKTA